MVGSTRFMNGASSNSADMHGFGDPPLAASRCGAACVLAQDLAEVGDAAALVPQPAARRHVTLCHAEGDPGRSEFPRRS